MLRKLLSIVIISVAVVVNVIIRVVVLLVVLLVLQDRVELGRRLNVCLLLLCWLIQNVIYIEVFVGVRLDRIDFRDLLLRVAARIYQIR
jgi:hypothetical protein